MTEYIASSREIERALEELHGVIASGGGMIHGRARLCERDGNFSIEAPGDIGAREVLVAVPQGLLIPMEGSGLVREGDAVEVRGPAGNADDPRVRILELLAQLYTATGKIAQHRSQSSFAFREHAPDLLSQLYFGAPPPTGSDGVSDPLLSDFLRTRSLTVPSQTEPSGTRQVLMPIIEFFNHAPRAPGSVLHNSSLVVTRGHPDPQSEECFTCYGRYDACDLFARYGFVLKHPEFVTSVPLEIALPGEHRVLVRRTAQPMNPDRIPDELRDLGWILPAVNFDSASKSLTMHYLPLIHGTPDEEDSTRRMLTFFLAHLMSGHSRSDVEQAVEDVIAEAVKNSLAFYRDQAVLVEARPRSLETEVVLARVQRMLEDQAETLASIAGS